MSASLPSTPDKASSILTCDVVTLSDGRVIDLTQEERVFLWLVRRGYIGAAKQMVDDHIASDVERRKIGRTAKTLMRRVLDGGTGLSARVLAFRPTGGAR
jgi:hypothetical protein